jgi:hypothetical protein
MHADVHTLFFDEHRIAELTDVFADQETWHAMYQVIPGIAPRLIDFIHFSKSELVNGDWDEKTLESYRDIVESTKWKVAGPRLSQQLDGAPLFDESEISWRVSATKADH